MQKLRDVFCYDTYLRDTRHFHLHSPAESIHSLVFAVLSRYSLLKSTRISPFEGYFILYECPGFSLPQAFEDSRALIFTVRIGLAIEAHFSKPPDRRDFAHGSMIESSSEQVMSHVSHHSESSTVLP